MNWFLTMPNDFMVYLFFWGPYILTILIDIVLFLILCKKIDKLNRTNAEELKQIEFKPKTISEEHKRKIAESQKKRWEEKRAKNQR